MGKHVNVNELVEKLSKESAEGVKRFSKSDYRDLVFAVLADEDFKAKKYLLRKDEIIEEEVSYNAAMRKFMDKLLKHAGLSDSSERQNVLDTFEYSPKDVEWVCDAVDEAMTLYVDSGKSMRVFRDKMHILGYSKMIRSGKHAGKYGYKKTVIDRAADLAKKKKK
jgi:CCR4-NOT transcriptional regulation complex NOT5 subunit